MQCVVITRVYSKCNRDDLPLVAMVCNFIFSVIYSVIGGWPDLDRSKFTFRLQSIRTGCSRWILQVQLKKFIILFLNVL